MKKFLVACLIVVMLVSTLSTALANFLPLANPVFHITSLYLYESFYVQFEASTMLLCPTISVSSCSIQKLVNGKWVHYQSLTPPSYVAENATLYGETEDYTAYKPTNGTYRIKATFTARGESVTEYSLPRTY
ncbi:MAG: hypothetical protein ACOX7B_09590 [Christensenellales bacterium]|jgi:hypothetical protein